MLNVMNPDRLYFDVTMSNLLNKTVDPPQLQFNQARSIPYLTNPSLYNMSIVRWTLDTQSLPIFIPTIKPGQDDPNSTIYSVTMEYMGNIHKKFVYFTPQDLTKTAPPAPKNQASGLQMNDGGYYNIYSYSYWIYLVNIALEQCFIGLQAQTALPSAYPPVMTFDTDKKTAIINVDLEGYSLSLENPIKIYFNVPLGNLFSSFPFKITQSTAEHGMNFMLYPDIYDFSVTDFPQANPTYQAIQVFQEYSTISNWNPVMAICVMSNTIGIVQNIEGMPTIFVNDTVINGSGNNSQSSNLITDFVADDYKPSIIYVPSGEYRRIEMVGSRPLSNLDISVFWKNREGALQPFRLSSGGSCTMKIMFEKKDLTK